MINKTSNVITPELVKVKLMVSAPSKTTALIVNQVSFADFFVSVSTHELIYNSSSGYWEGVIELPKGSLFWYRFNNRTAWERLSSGEELKYRLLLADTNRTINNKVSSWNSEPVSKGGIIRGE